MLILDIAIVNVALPSMQRTLGLSAENSQWVVGGYVVAMGRLAAIPLVLVEAEPVPGVVAKQGLDAVGPLGRLLQEGDAFAF